MSVRPYILFDGNAREAIAHYESVFDTRSDAIITFGEMPSNPDFAIPDEVKSRVWISHMKISGDTVLMSDIWPTPGFTVGHNVDILYFTPSVEEIRRVYERLLEGGSAQVPMDVSSETRAYANVTDKFGVTWQLSTSETLI